VDYGGRTRGSADYFAAADRQVLTAELPTNGVRTIYSRIGDVFAWICLACLLALTVASRSRRRVPRLEEARAPETGRE
jgi:apolipoprotein N-acyltransferase